jgi:hypothetical protein
LPVTTKAKECGMTSIKVTMRRVIIWSGIMGATIFLCGTSAILVDGDTQQREELVLLGGFCLFMFLAAIPLLRLVYKNIPSQYYHWED